MKDGERPRRVFVLTEGFACRCKILEDGRRQILTFLIPGDVCDLHVFLLRRMDHCVAVVTRARVRAIDTPDVIDMIFENPRLAAGLWWSMLQEEALLRERIVALGRRDAEGRVASILCELLWRLEAVGETRDGPDGLPLTQEELADALGLTPSYVNRVLGRMRADRLITVRRDQMRIEDAERLRALAGFDSAYLYLSGAPEEMQAFFGRMQAERQAG